MFDARFKTYMTHWHDFGHDFATLVMYSLQSFGSDSQTCDG